MRRLRHGNCTAAGPVDPGAWAAGTACYAGVWTNLTTVSYKPSAGVGSATIYVFEYDMPSEVNGWAPVNLHYAQHVVVRNLTLQGPAWEVVSAVGSHHITVSADRQIRSSHSGLISSHRCHMHPWNCPQGDPGGPPPRLRLKGRDAGS